MKKRLLSVLLCAAMVLPAAVFAQSSAAVGPVSAVAAAAAVDPLKKYDPPIQLTTAKTEITTYSEGQDAQNNVMYDAWKELLGIEVINKIQVPAAAMKDRMQLAIASNDIPDFAVVDTVMLSTLTKNDMIEDMTDIYDTWASDNLKEVMSQADNALFVPGERDGRYMALPVPNTLGDYIPILWIRKDWLDALGLEEPKTMEEVFDVAMAFTTQDPDKNGEDDTYGLYMDKDLQGLEYLMAAYEVYISRANRDEFIVKQADGSYMAGCIDPKAKAPLGKLAELYAVGGIDPEFAIKDATKAGEMTAAGRIGIFLGLFFHPLGTIKDSHINVGAEWIPLPMPAAEGVSKYTVGVPLNVYGYIYAKKGIANPEAIVVMMNHLCDGYAAPWLSNFENPFYKKYNEIAAAGHLSLNNIMPFQLNVNFNWAPVFQEALATGATEVPGKDADFKRLTDMTSTEADRWAWGKVYLEGYDVLDFENVRYSDYNGAPTDTMVKNSAILYAEKLKTYVSIIMGDQPVDSFDTFAATYQKIGGQKISEEIAEALAN